MAETIINTPSSSTPPEYNNNGMWNFLGLLLTVVVILLLVFYGIPAIGSALQNMSGPQIQVPGRINVNLNQTK